MTRILRGGSKGKVLTGLPGFKRVTAQGATGQKVAKNASGKSGVRRLIARDPANGNSALIGTSKEVPIILGKVKPAVNATLTTALAGANNDLKYTAKVGGTVGNAITVRYVVAGANTAFSVGVVGSAITVNLATDAGSVATSTANAIMAGIIASAPASALVTVALATGNDGTGVAVALGATNLTGGVNAVTTEADDVNTVGSVNPNIVKAPNLKKGNAEPVGRSHVVKNNINRRLRRR